MTLSQPEYMWFNGEIAPWAAGNVHVWTEVAIRGASVFEGLRAYWNETHECYRVVSVDEHLQRMRQSIKILRFPKTNIVDQLEQGMRDLLGALDYRDHTYLRPTVYIENGRYAGEGSPNQVGAYIVAFPVGMDERPQLRCCVSSWRRADDLTMPPRAKTGAAYASLRYPILEAADQGMDEAIILNDRGKIAEASAASVFIVRGNEVITPPVSAGILESITRSHVINLVRGRADLRVVEREVDRTELYVADEVFLAGTLMEVKPVTQVDRIDIGDGDVGPVTDWVRDSYRAACIGIAKQDPSWIQQWRPIASARG